MNIKKRAVTALLLALAAASLAAPAHADDDHRDFGGGSGHATVGDCLEGLVDMPFLGEAPGNYQRNCSSGNTGA
ncbi:hypothetical protein [Streptomyces sp. NPDC048659]|uniref:hypothetical protein n=1 Tax=Streptomyces sp. NPDC048659 TaxID=3155489 RepID=UPI003416EE55